jgi:hypothetical protein
MSVEPFRAALVLLAFTLAALGGCGKAPSLSSLTGGDRPKEPADMVAVSPVQPGPGRPLTPARTLPRLELVPSQGDCAPRYADGQMGTCINSRPCRGLGMRAARGGAECRCWAVAGGCGEAERCDGVAKACVPDDKSVRGETD